MMWLLTTLAFHSNEYQVPRSVQVAARATDKVLYQHESLAPGGDVDWIPALRNTTEIVHLQWQQNIRKINCAVT